MRGPGSAERSARRRTGAFCAGILVLVLAASALAACQPDTSARRTVTVLAASSLADALPPLLAPLADDGLDVRMVFAASSTLARQVEAGAPADLFFSADERWLDRLIDGGWMAGDSRRVPISNRLVLIGQRDTLIGNDARMTPVEALDRALAALPSDGRLVLGDPAHVPAGRYAQAALSALDRWDALAGRLAFADNVRAALALVDRGDASLGVVYATDVALSRRVAVLTELPLTDAQPIRYALGSAAGVDPSRRADVERVYATLTDARAREHFLALGFTAP